MLTLKILDAKGRARFLNLDGYREATFDTFEGEPYLDLTIDGWDPEPVRLAGADALLALRILEDDAEVTRLAGRPTIEPDRPDDWERLVGFKGRPMFPVEVDVPTDFAEVPGGDEATRDELDIAAAFIREELASGDMRQETLVARLWVCYRLGRDVYEAACKRLGVRVWPDHGGAWARLSEPVPIRDAAASVVAGFAREADQVVHRHHCRDCRQEWCTSTARDRVRDDCPFCGGLNTRKGVLPVAAAFAGRPA